MTHPALIWIGALAISAGLHAASAYGLYLATRPGNVPDQALPETEMQLSAYRVQRSEARETRPESDQAASGDTSGSNVSQGRIATSQAAPMTPDTAAADIATPRGRKLRADLADATDVQSVADPGAEIAAQSITQTALAPSATPTGDAVASRPLTPLHVARSQPVSQTTAVTARPPSQQIAVASPSSNTLAPAPAAGLALTGEDALSSIPAATVQPATMRPEPGAIESEIVDQPQLDRETASEAPPRALAVARQRVDAPRAPAIVPPADRARANLAFPDPDDGRVDPVSLAAFQSFMEPDDLSRSAAEVRDGIKATLSAIPCSRLQVQYDPDDNSLLVSGHVPDPELRDTVVSAMQAQMGQDIPVREGLLILPRPQCGALSGIASVGLPQSTDQITNPLLLGEDTHAREFRYTAGSPLVMALQGADYDAYVYVDYFDADGNVLHLSPNQYTPLEKTEAKSELQIGSDHVLEPGEPGLYIEIGPPFGQEIAVAFAASTPLYDGVRPLVEPAAAYLGWLREKVAEARVNDPDFKGEWVYFFISTSVE